MHRLPTISPVWSLTNGLVRACACPPRTYWCRRLGSKKFWAPGAPTRLSKPPKPDLAAGPGREAPPRKAGPRRSHPRAAVAPPSGAGPEPSRGPRRPGKPAAIGPGEHGEAVTPHAAAACRVEVINSSPWLTKLTSCFRAGTDHDAPLGRLLGRKPPVDAKGDRWNRLGRDCASIRKRRDGRLSRLSRWSPFAELHSPCSSSFRQVRSGLGLLGRKSPTTRLFGITRTPGTRLRRRSPTRF